MFKRTVPVIAVFVVGTVIVGCSSEEEDPGMKVETACLRTLCDVKQARSSSYCSQCLSLCMGASFDCDPSERCKLSCGDSPSCDDQDRETCSESGFKATLPTTKSEAVAVACRKMFDRAVSCGFETPISVTACDVWAKTEKPEVAANYECTAALPCEDDGASCARPETDFGDRLCDVMASICGEEHCGEENRLILNHSGGWLKDSVQNAGLGCAAQATCGDAKKCFAVWTNEAKL
jgi:hypothetical protein